MPSVYAHYSFGKQIIPMLPKDLRAIVRKYREPFNLGLQGPDVLFFYRPYRKNYVNVLGHTMHNWSGSKFFQPAARRMRAMNHHHDRAVSYLLGTLCHYALDLVCHPYVEELVHTKGMNHNGIESALERALLIRDGHPYNTLVSKSLHISPLTAEVASEFYGKTTGRQVYEASKIMIIANDGLRMKEHNPIKRLIFFIAGLLKVRATLETMVIPPEPNPLYTESDAELMRRFEESKPVALELIAEFMSSLETGKHLSAKFKPTYLG